MNALHKRKLLDLGWCSFYEQSLSDAGEPSVDALCLARVVQVQRSGLSLLEPEGKRHIALSGHWLSLPGEERPTVGDWVVLAPEKNRIERLVPRKTLIKRLAPGTHREVQLIAANLDTLFIVSSCNDEFNPSRLERYLSLAQDAGVQPVMVLTKMDLCDDHWQYLDRVREIEQSLVIDCVNALDSTTLKGLRAWCIPGQTVALVGSSGVGKSTLVNSLAGAELMNTGTVRTRDKRGRHTTTYRSLQRLHGGALLLDCPGMKELQLAAQEGKGASGFNDIHLLARGCRFSNCVHDQEPGCRVQAALAEGQLDQRRFTNYRKLLREQQYAEETVAQRHQRVRKFSRKVRQSQLGKPKKRH